MPLMTLLWGFVIVVVYAGVTMWIVRRRRLPALTDLPDSEMRRLLPASITLWILTGVFFGFIVWYVLLYALPGSHLPTWIPPQALFIPMMLGQICAAFAGRPPARR